MLANRSIPQSTVIPVLAYPDAQRAASWLGEAFGFTVRIDIGTHRVQLNVGDGAVIVRELRPGEEKATLGIAFAIMVRVEDVDGHFRQARKHGARILQEPQTFPYGERQYIAQDHEGYTWTFSQSVADVTPEEWGGTSIRL
jgi:uncharacterized glyoxalase superfamily protein PhnB